MRQHVVWDTGAGVLDGETYVVSRRRLFRPEGLAFDNGVERLESERAARLHRIPGVDGEVENDQLDLVWIDQSRPEIRRKCRFELHRAAQGEADCSSRRACCLDRPRGVQAAVA